MSYNELDIDKTCLDLNIQQGDSLFIHTGLKSLGQFSSKKNIALLDALFQSLQKYTGNNGTLSVPTFNFDFFNSSFYDHYQTPSIGMGAFSEFIRTNPNSMRSLHPFHSISSIGKYAKKISTSHGISEFSEGSFFDCLLKLNTKVLFIGVSFVETLAHLAEERACVPYRSWITVSGKIKKNDSVEEVAQKFYARKLRPIEYHINIPKIYDFLKSRSIIKITNLGSGTASICNSNEMVSALTQKMEESPYFFTTNNAI